MFVLMLLKKTSRRLSLDIKITKRLFRCECALQRNSKREKRRIQFNQERIQDNKDNINCESIKGTKDINELEIVRPVKFIN